MIMATAQAIQPQGDLFPKCPVCGGIILGDVNGSHQGYFTCAVCGWRSAPCCEACKQTGMEGRV